MSRVLLSALLAIVVAGTDLARAEGEQQTACPLRFDADTTGLPATCLFVGPFNSACGANAAGVFAGNGDMVVVGIALSRTSPVTFFSGEVLSDTRGTITLWQRAPELPDLQPVIGSVVLEDGRTLRLRLSAPPFRVDGCPFQEFVGHFVALVDVPDDLAPDEGKLADPERAAARQAGDQPS